MCQRVLVRLEAAINRRALIGWRAHTEASLRRRWQNLGVSEMRWQNLGVSQMSSAVDCNRLTMIDRFVLSSLRFSFMRWGMRIKESRPFARLVESQRKRHAKQLVTGTKSQKSA